MNRSYMRGFVPYALAAALVGIVGGFSSVLGPAFVRDLGLDYGNTTWTALATAISAAACAPVLGRLADALGRGATLLGGLLVFTLGNALCALAPNLPVMLLARFVVGLGTAAIAPVVLSYIVTRFPQDRLASGFALYMLISSSAVIFGPTLGGLLVESHGWRALMWVCTAISGLVLVLCLIARPESQRGRLGAFDGLGAALVPVFFGLALCVPSFGQSFGWRSGPFLTVLCLGALALVVLILAEGRAESPILRGSFMGRKAFILPVLALFLTQGLLQANMTNTMVFVSYTQPDNTLISGYAVSILYLGMALGSVLLGPLADRWEPRWVLTGSLALTALGCGLMLLFTAQAGLPLLAGSLGLLGFGLGGNGAIFMKVVLSGLPPQAAGAGTGTYGLFRDLAAPFGVAVFVPMFTGAVTDTMASGVLPAQAAVASIHTLAIAELLSIAAGIAITQALPKIHKAS